MRNTQSELHTPIVELVRVEAFTLEVLKVLHQMQSQRKLGSKSESDMTLNIEDKLLRWYV